MPRNDTRNMATRLAVALCCLAPVPASLANHACGQGTADRDVRQAVDSGDAVLAYRKGDLTRDGTPGLVVAVSHGARAGQASRGCELIVFTGHGGRWKRSASNERVVACPGHTLPIPATELAFQDFLDITPGIITWANGPATHWEAFDFFYDARARGWFVLSASTARSPDGTKATGHAGNAPTHSGSIGAPHDFPFIPMADFDPGDLRTTLASHVRVTP